MPVPTTEELEEFIENTLRENLKTLRNVRNRRELKIRTRALALLFILVPATFILTWIYGAHPMGGSFDFMALVMVVPTMALLFGVLYFALRQWYYFKDLPFEYKPDILAPLIHFIDLRLLYRPAAQIAPDHLKHSRIITDDLDDFECRDLFKGNLRGIELEFADISAANLTKSFYGLFLVATYPTPVDGLTVVTTNPSDIDTNGLDDELNTVSIIDLDDNLHALSTSPENAEKVLNTKTIAGLAEIQKSLGESGDDRFYMTFFEDRLFFARPGPNYFDRPPQRPLTDTSHLHQVGRELRSVIDFTETLKNTFTPR